MADVEGERSQKFLQTEPELTDEVLVEPVAGRDLPPLALYLHWPYCARICPYCDFNVYRDRGREVEPLIAAMIADLAAHREIVGPRALSSVFFGGGTPSLLEPKQIQRILAAADQIFGIEAGAEITLEANPTDSEASRFADFVAAGVNRLSIGVQSLEDLALRALGRTHDAAEAIAAVEEAAKTSARVSLDLIYAREGQSPEQWAAELREALTLPVEHLSLYQLTIEPQTAFGRRFARSKLNPPEPDLAAHFFEITQNITAAAGFPAYEISNHARAPAAQSRHNLIYWRGEDYLGIGPGAHGRLPGPTGARLATKAVDHPRAYIDQIAARAIGWEGPPEVLTADAIAGEYALMGIRLAEGLDLARLERHLGRQISAKSWRNLVDLGLVGAENGRILLSEAGRLLADRVALALIEPPPRR
ncbi:MAG TPA: coproporphyrinogen III oxidase [Hyphomonadaceae bacterium]|nr:coproporphyrinogen III oxidase [Hyphomonadaceae bacterium]